MNQVSMASPAASSDIDLCISEALQHRIHDGDLIVGDPSLTQEIQETHRQHVDGMYVWALLLFGTCANV